MKIRTILGLTVIVAALVAISLWMGEQAYHWMPPQASAESIMVDNLFSFLVAVGSFIFLGVSVALIYSVLFQRAGKYDTSDGPPIEGNIPLEIVWTAVPFVLIVWIGIQSFQTYQQMAILGPMEHIHMAMEEPVSDGAIATLADQSANEASIEVLARQWAWEFRYPQYGISSTELHLPNNQRATLTLKSEDVIHGFFVPAFRIKQDVIPNQAIKFEFTPIQEGKYRIRDSQYSGTYFAAMQADVVVESPEAYREWLTKTAKQPPVVAYNAAFEDYRQASEKGVSAGWKTLPPAPPPLVNYSGSPLAEE